VGAGSLLHKGESACSASRKASVEAEYRLVLSGRFEDVCGNRLGEALDHLLAARQ
jgi:hypothetical protein